MFEMTTTLIGGLGIFLLGMKYMSQGLQSIAGASLRRLIGAVTNNRVLATLVGFLVTVLVQSSSVTTVMTVGFVNGGLMSLTQAIGVIMGANVGTTITGWILVLKIGKYGLPMLGVSAFVYLFTKREKVRYTALAVMGVGMVFFGLQLMKDACKFLKDLPEFQEWFLHFTADTYIGLYQCMLVGCILTVLVQSSSATLGITISLAATGLIPFDTAAALVLGENIGTTVTALLASLGTTTNARRAAYFHVLFNITGVIWVSTIFFWYVEFIPWLIDVDVTKAVMIDGQPTYPDCVKAIAATHSVFNILNTLVFLPFAGQMATLLTYIVKDKPQEIVHLRSLDIRILETPVLAIEQSRGEVIKMGVMCDEMIQILYRILSQEIPEPADVEKLFHHEEELDRMQDEITSYITHLLAMDLPQEVISKGRRQLRMADEYESISDYLQRIAKFRLKLNKQGRAFDETHNNSLLDVLNMVEKQLSHVTISYQQEKTDIVSATVKSGNEIKNKVKTLSREHLEYLSAEKVDPYINVSYTATLNALRRVRDHVINLAEALAGEK
ncbi:Na/Pi cotransporter family protein [uncultured Gimesia sp.]|jgi:phosphate:Na+ symporter|uniref:Na/Pi cotransporter family protein n=1 Tax=uncultured Gimesia sp. TaxID=1678688 RepID=UPI0026376D6F|nr:Na/Pi cotransporter family protein [uncultured Gimesia sp.]